MVPLLHDTLKEHQARNEWLEHRDSGEGRGTTNDDYLFLSNQGTLRQPSCLSNAFKAGLKAAGIKEHITPHGLRYAFNDMLRRSGIDPISARALTGHSTEPMHEHYSSVQLDHKRVAIARLAEHLNFTQVEGLVEGRPRKQKTASTSQEKAA